jgi:hypothetical protein
MGASTSPWVPLQRKIAEGRAVAELVDAGASINAAAAALGMSRMTGWRRYYFWRDWDREGRRTRRIPRQRGLGVRRGEASARRRLAAPAAPPPLTWLDVYGVARCPACREAYPARLDACPHCRAQPGQRRR